LLALLWYAKHPTDAAHYIFLISIHITQRDEILRSKEDEIRAKIRQKELQSLSKAELMLYEQRQRAWMIAVISLSRFK
jgi:hypothetical protein